ncbi:MAG: DUF2066 domain-containing protein [Mizugakiibacter sp.]|uniref:DUF2066 domain-containing protein n=1 Tax=Mizugakiibacter sp. TaxID=1972610 RepID=UPI0031BC5EEA|nr:DUF2066 domain-containing protein [Xanthomonadaceae bacterium]
MMRPPGLLAALLLLTTMALPLRAAEDPGLYAGEAAVADTSDAQRDQAFDAALAQVLVKLSGDRNVGARPGVAEALAQAATLVQQYQYRQEGGAAGLRLQAHFDPAAVRRLAGSLRLGVWPGPRPPVLVLVRGPDGALLGEAQCAGLVQAGAARGLRFVFPAAGDAPDAAALTVGDEAALARVARGYRTGLVLTGSLGAGNAAWVLVGGGAPQRWQDAGPPAGLLANAGDATADRLIPRFAAAPGGSGGSATLWVSGIDAAADFAAMLAQLRQDPQVRGAMPLAAQGDGVLLQLRFDGDLAGVLNDFAADGRMLPTAAHPGADAALRWLR